MFERIVQPLFVATMKTEKSDSVQGEIPPIFVVLIQYECSNER